MANKLCPKCQFPMNKEYKDGYYKPVYLAWVCPRCGYEEKDEN